MPMHKDSRRENRILPKYVGKYVWKDGRNRSGVTVEDYVDVDPDKEDYE